MKSPLNPNLLKTLCAAADCLVLVLELSLDKAFFIGLCLKDSEDLDFDLGSFVLGADGVAIELGLVDSKGLEFDLGGFVLGTGGEAIELGLVDSEGLAFDLGGFALSTGGDAIELGLVDSRGLDFDLSGLGLDVAEGTKSRLCLVNMSRRSGQVKSLAPF